MSTPDSSAKPIHDAIAGARSQNARPAGQSAATSTRPWAMVVTRNLPPLVGGMERLVWHIVDELRPVYHIHVIGPKGCRSRLPDGVTATEVRLKPMYLYLLITKLATLWHALRRQPELVFAGSGLTAPFAWLAARLCGARCIVYLHGLDIETRHPIYRLLWRPLFRRFDRILVNSRFTRQLAQSAGVPPKRITILHPGVNLPDPHGAPAQVVSFRERHGLGDHPVLLYVGRITARKGLAAFVQDILPQILSKRPDTRLLVIGNEPTQALHHQSGERQRVIDALRALHLGDRVLFLREINDDALHTVYFAADALVFPVQERPWDHEGFGMVAIEAAAHGLPTVAFASGGVVDAIDDYVSGRLIPAGDTRAFADAVLEIVERADTAHHRVACRHFAERFAWALFGEALRSSCCPSSSTNRSNTK